MSKILTMFVCAALCMAPAAIVHAKASEFTIQAHKGQEMETKQVSSRDYSYLPTEKEVKDIAYIIETMSVISLPGLLKKRAELRAIAAQIRTLHPLRFFETVFADTNLRTHFVTLRGRFYIWDRFFAIITGICDEELECGGFTEESIADFSQNMAVDEEQITTLIEAGNWVGLVDYLIAST